MKLLGNLTQSTSKKTSCSTCSEGHVDTLIARDFQSEKNLRKYYFYNMHFEYRIKDQHGQYFVTFTVHQWVDVFTRKEYVDILLDSLIFCQKNKGLNIYAWVIMTNHIHLIINGRDGKLSDIIRDFKKFTSSQVISAIENNPKESRKRWMLWFLKKDDKLWFWEEGYHGEEIISKSFFDSKINYIHMNPVKANIVGKEEDYLYSSCGDFYGTRKGLLKLEER